MGDQMVAPEMGIMAFDLECMAEASTWSASRRRRPGQCHAAAGCGKLMIVKLCVGMHVLPTQKLGVGMHVLPTQKLGVVISQRSMDDEAAWASDF